MKRTLWVVGLFGWMNVIALSASANPFEELNQSTIRNILSFLDLKSLSSVSQVNHSLSGEGSAILVDNLSRLSVEQLYRLRKSKENDPEWCAKIDECISTRVLRYQPEESFQKVRRQKSPVKKQKNDLLYLPDTNIVVKVNRSGMIDKQFKFYSPKKLIKARPIQVVELEISPQLRTQLIELAQLHEEIKALKRELATALILNRPNYVPFHEKSQNAIRVGDDGFFLTDYRVWVTHNFATFLDAPSDLIQKETQVKVSGKLAETAIRLALRFQVRDWLQRELIRDPELLELLPETSGITNN